MANGHTTKATTYCIQSFLIEESTITEGIFYILNSRKCSRCSEDDGEDCVHRKLGQNLGRQISAGAVSLGLDITSKAYYWELHYTEGGFIIRDVTKNKKIATLGFGFDYSLISTGQKFPKNLSNYRRKVPNRYRLRRSWKTIPAKAILSNLIRHAGSSPAKHLNLKSHSTANNQQPKATLPLWAGCGRLPYFLY